jgi:hypothetical protein
MLHTATLCCDGNSDIVIPVCSLLKNLPTSGAAAHVAMPRFAQPVEATKAQQAAMALLRRVADGVQS